MDPVVEIKAGQYGLKGLMAYPVITNSETEYKVGTAYSLRYAMELGGDADVAEQKIFADDEVYVAVREEKGVNLTLTLAELPIALKAKVAGGTYDETLKKYTFPAGSTRPTIALRNISQFVSNGGWHVEYATVCEVTGVEMQGNKVTRDDGVTVNGVNLLLYSKPRLCDSQRVIEYEPTSQLEKDAAEADFIKGVLGT